MKENKQSEFPKVVYVRLKEADHAMLKELSRQEDRSIASIIRRMIAERVRCEAA